MTVGLTRRLLAPVGPAEAYLHMLAAVGEDLAASVVTGGERDPFESREPVYIERTLPALRLGSKLYFRDDVRGLDNIPAEGPVLLVGNHAGGRQETALFLGQGRRLARALQFYRHLRLKVLPAALGPPFGLTILDLPGRFPLPAKISIRVSRSINLHRRLGKRADAGDGYELDNSTMQRTLTRHSNERSLPILG
ncbi:MAG: hypothetical protein JO363_04415 [Solirubrobacterales bacterium]|nr:hypothetical protein [Solirubrobacterales bacterium]